MPTSHDLKGLMKFLERDEWKECFGEVFDDHFGPVLDASGMEFADLADVVGDIWAMTIWGVAFEDFLTQDFDVPGGNIVDEYLKRRGWKEGAQSKAYMKALRTSVLSLYEVSDVVPGKSMMVRDLIRGGEPLAVSEGSATKKLKQWDKIAARVVPVSGTNVLGGGLLPFTQNASDNLFDGLRALFGAGKRKKLRVPTDEELQSAASVFTLSWLFDVLGQAMGSDLPELSNSHGEEIVFHDVRFPLATGASQRELAARLNAIDGFTQENTKYWNWSEDKPKGRGRSKQTEGVALDATMDNGACVLGNVELKGRFLCLSANSAARAGRGIAIIKQSLGDLVRTPLTEIRTVAQVMAERPERNSKPSSDLPPEVAEEMVHQYLDRQYRETLDQPVGMLGNKTPRQAVKSATGRQKVVDWLKYLENQSAKHSDRADPMATYSFQWMWAELGVQDLRR